MATLWAIGKFVLFMAGLGLAVYVYLLFMRGLNQIPEPKDQRDKDQS
ncbi:hypothetical protein IM700_018680 [Paenibacillus sp. DXFW5]|uniref:Uncharacterized protein n=1 Tax=Paenibacillus rhizolycopersici TaxID=2780073 RepID=A0ABS2HAC9_9BACL|nr:MULTISPECIES: hypothetical protein [Paenibacillus]MBM6997691.1 hypothetical protein [Paenibacillus rhizolycopersici]MUG87399.1 hypothetical protein [Paenibacillus timonensis]GIP47191.1 hypothetical protein J53TS2_07820 [Paenibacillus sp. J53TS2]